MAGPLLPFAERHLVKEWQQRFVQQRPAKQVLLLLLQESGICGEGDGQH